MQKADSLSTVGSDCQKSRFTTEKQQNKIKKSVPHKSDKYTFKISC